MTFEKSQKGYLLLNEPYMFVFWEKYISVLGFIRIQSGFKPFGSRILGFQSGNNTKISVVTGLTKKRDISDYRCFRQSVVSVCTFHADLFGIDGILLQAF